jgi:sterol desaturase/sphingolipid hydroxylase (fatty acid hydroxylase superfamily)
MQFTAFFPILVVLIVALWEVVAPCRKSEMSRLYRWVNTGGMRFACKVFVRLLVPWLLLILTIAFLDLGSYSIHVACHYSQVLWRAHRPHHIDTEFDITTTLRNHPFDDLLNILTETLLVVALGLSAEGILIFGAVSGTISKFSHANVEIPARIDRILRWFIVTPNMHRIHHSAVRHENDSNFGNHFTLWDRLFGTYIVFPNQPHATMVVGQYNFRDAREIRFDRLLLSPFHDRK